MEPNSFLYMSIFSLIVFFATIATLMALKLYWQAILCMCVVVSLGVFYSFSLRLKCQKNKTQIQPSVHYVPENQIKIIRPGITSNYIDVEITTESKTEYKTESKNIRI